MKMTWSFGQQNCWLETLQFCTRGSLPFWARCVTLGKPKYKCLNPQANIYQPGNHSYFIISQSSEQMLHVFIWMPILPLMLKNHIFFRNVIQTRKKPASFTTWGGVWTMEMVVKGHLSHSEEKDMSATVQEETVNFRDNLVNLDFVV